MTTGDITSSPRIESAIQRGRLDAIVRRTLDVTVAVAMLVVLVPLLVIIALAIRLNSRGPVIFRQRRVGGQLKEFTVHKFRTMYAEADPAPHRHYVAELIRNAPQGPTPGLYKLTDDQRVTRVGRYLRKLSLDELPQLWDVLRGDMSLVGPRPVVPYEVEHYAPSVMRRFAVKPGLTGLWQVSGRNRRTYEEMLQLDVEYAERRSLALDLLILLKTPRAVLRRNGTA
jgi:lipopolysaccharide/colanic/teichoic acid biosynthesis glycosyltransferase